MRIFTPTALALFFTASAAAADITIDFQEGAPKDRFVVQSSCLLGNVDLTIDLRGSAGALIFDVTADGAGVEVFQPVEIQTGSATMAPIVDGDQMLELQIDMIPNDTGVIISADLDDVLTASDLGQIRVSGAELDGAQVTLSFDGQTMTEVFAGGGNSVKFDNGCLS